MSTPRDTRIVFGEHGQEETHNTQGNSGKAYHRTTARRR
jgi:hypothetical protein